MDTKQNNSKPNNLSNLNTSKSFIKTEKEQQKIIYDLLYSVKETENLANPGSALRYNEKESILLKQKQNQEQPQSSLSSHYFSTQKSSLKSAKR